MRIFLDMDDVCNTFTPYALYLVGCPVSPTSYEGLPDVGYDIVAGANILLGEQRFTTEASFWEALGRKTWADTPRSPLLPWLLATCESVAGRDNIYIATSTTKDPDCLAGKLEWIHKNLPDWLHRQYFITPRKWLLATRDSILIDDYSVNVDLFRKHGGNAITVPAPWNDLWATPREEHILRNLLGIRATLGLLNCSYL
jgi:hypothetical protein